MVDYGSQLGAARCRLGGKQPLPLVGADVVDDGRGIAGERLGQLHLVVGGLDLLPPAEDQDPFRLSALAQRRADRGPAALGAMDGRLLVLVEVLHDHGPPLGQDPGRVAVLGRRDAALPDRRPRPVGALDLQYFSVRAEHHDRVVGADQPAGLLGDHRHCLVGVLLGRPAAHQLSQRLGLATPALGLAVEPCRLQSRSDLGGQQGQQLDLVPGVPAVPLGGHAQRAQGLLARHHRHPHGRLDPALEGPGDGVERLPVVVDDHRLPALEGLAEGPVADLDPLAVAIKLRLAGEQAERLGDGIPPAQGGALRLQELAGAVHHQPAQLAKVAQATGGDRHFVQGPEVVCLLDRLLRQAGGLDRGRHLGCEEHQQLLVVIAPLPAAATEDADRADGAVRHHQGHREATLNAALH